MLCRSHAERPVPHSLVARLERRWPRRAAVEQRSVGVHPSTASGGDVIGVHLWGFHTGTVDTQTRTNLKALMPLRARLALLCLYWPV